MELATLLAECSLASSSIANVRRQMIWDRVSCCATEALARYGFSLGRGLVVQQAACLDCLTLDLLSSSED